MTTEALLPDIPVLAIDDQKELYTAVEALRNNLEERMQVLLGGNEITLLDLTASGSYTASELQTVSDKVDTILEALQSAGIVK